MALLNGKWFRNIFVQETPSGLVNGSNTTFTLTHTPIFNSAHILYINGLAMSQGVHYTLSGNTITMLITPAAGQLLYSFYLRSF